MPTWPGGPAQMCFLANLPPCLGSRQLILKRGLSVAILDEELKTEISKGPGLNVYIEMIMIN